MKTLPLAIVVLMCAPASAQWAKVPPTPIPRTADGKPNLSAPAPRLADGKPDLSGIWAAPTGYLRNLAKDLKDEVPFQEVHRVGFIWAIGGHALVPCPRAGHSSAC